MATSTQKQIKTLESQLADIRNTIQTKGSTPELRAQRLKIQTELQKLREAATTEVNEGKELFESYGYAYGLIESDPSLQAVFEQFLKSGSSWEEPKLEAEIRKSDWYKNNTNAKRNYEILRTGDPTEFNKQLSKATEAILEQARLTGAVINEQQARGFAEQIMQGGITKEQLPKIFASTFIDFGNADLVGRAGALQDKFNMLNNNAGKVLNQNQINGYVQKILTNELLENDVLDSIRRASASKYARFSDRIIAGEDIQDIATPWLNMATQLLERPNIDLEDNLMLDALTSNKYESLSDFKKAIKNDPRWQTTDNARSEYFNVGKRILEDFGLLG